jgi:serine/threonine protein kinase/tetratricopeptide (TPR) repeat protein
MIPRARWQQIQSLFEQLADVDDAQRAAHLERSCGNDAELRQSVESLLNLDKGRRDPLLHAIGAAAESLLEDHRDRLIGTRVGPYRIVSILGHGGMSVVYRGERDDSQYQQTVAIKVLQHAALHPRLRSRLHSERHILATLDHPCIARLIDSGDLDDGTPYLVMEHVDGDAIDVFCDNHTLFIRERLELFVEVCAAVHYAHRNLVVHRDIKASNIFVTEERTPKLLDFGIAKLLAPESLSHTLPVTRLQERILTPENAAPEQVLGRPITTATDVYALGVLLYQLLTGRSPYRLLSYSQLQLERAICMDDPTRPSQVVIAKVKGESAADRSKISDRRGLSPPRLQARLAGDLDAIVAMAMRKEPERRYPSVEAFADDVRRHLSGQPVRARSGDWRYNAAKFLRRNFLATAAAAAVILGLVLIAGLAMWENHRLGLARDATAQERDRAQQVSAFLVDVFSRADPFNAQGKDPTAKELLDNGAEAIRKNTSLQPEVRATLLEAIAVPYRRLFHSDYAIPLFEEVVAIRKSERPVDNRRVAEALANLSQALMEAGRWVSAEQDIKDALDMLQAGDARPTVETADLLSQYGQLYLTGKSDPVSAESMFKRALAIYRSLPDEQSLSIARTWSALASTSVWAGNFDQAEDYQRKALNIFRATTSSKFPDHNVALASLGQILTRRGKYVEAEEDLNEALQVETAVFGADNPRSAAIESDLSNLYQQEGDLERAIKASQEALRIARLRLGDNNTTTGYYHDGLAMLYLQTGNLTEAEASERQALAVYSATLPARHLYVAAGEQLLGEVQLRRHAYADAERELRSAYDLEVSLGAADWQVARTAASLAWLAIETGDAAQGEPQLIEARAKLIARLGPRNPESQLATTRLAQYLRAHHRDAEAAKLKPAAP